jgi:hypothetical protein
MATLTRLEGGQKRLLCMGMGTRKADFDVDMGLNSRRIEILSSELQFYYSDHVILTFRHRTAEMPQ